MWIICEQLQASTDATDGVINQRRAGARRRVFADNPPYALAIGNALMKVLQSDDAEELERAKGIEPSYEAWEASVLPLNYARNRNASNFLLRICAAFYRECELDGNLC